MVASVVLGTIAAVTAVAGATTAGVQGGKANKAAKEAGLAQDQATYRAKAIEYSDAQARYIEETYGPMAQAMMA